MKLPFIAIIILLAVACNKTEQVPETLFTQLSTETTKIDFVNQLDLTKDMDVFRYRNYYNGGGVAIGDINNDGLADIYFTSNMKDNKLYLNKGNFQFEDITEKAGVAGNYSWSTGVSIADVNGDGLLDIYVCNSGDRTGGRRHNELFINNGDLTFSDQAEQFGLNDKGFSTHAVFFDYDNDSDLDCYILNNSFRPVSSLGLENIRHIRDSTGGDKLYRNEDNIFKDVSTEAGIFGSVIGFGLGVTATDINLDGWIDLYISNDFFERDYLYLNQKDGTFSEELTERFGHTSYFSMGTDAADLNNDGAPDLYITDMLPEDDYRLKTTTGYDNYDLQVLKRKNGFYEQHMRNTLQLNDGEGRFVEVGQYAGVHATDWSWGTLLADFNNDGLKEIFVTNGIYKDITNRDFTNYLASDEAMLTAMRSETVDFQSLVDKMPSNPISNYMFQLDTSFRYKNITSAWGLDKPSFSNGTAYGDLDNDGDLDLVINNLNMPTFIYRNNTLGMTSNNFLKIKFEGKESNRFGIGARVHIYYGSNQQMMENLPNKGFQSSMNHEMIFGLDSIKMIDSIVVYWNHELKQTLIDEPTNQTIILNIANASNYEKDAEKEGKALSFTQLQLAEFHHKENKFIDFDRERLIYHMLSKEGPALAVGDVNKDGLDDFFIGGAIGQAGALYIQNRAGKFTKTSQPAFEKDIFNEDVDATFFDANGDGNLDLYVVSGGYELESSSRDLIDRLYLLEDSENPVFKRATENIPEVPHLGSCVTPADYDNDGDTDLFIGGRGVPGSYGMPANSYLLENDGTGNFINVTGTKGSKLLGLGMVTEAVFADYDLDEDLDLIVVGEWMPVTIFKNTGGNFQKLNNIPGLVNSNGWWNTIHATDYNNDGNIDFIAGNLGLNSVFKASPDYPLNLYISDFDNNGALDHIFSYYENEVEYPVALRDNIIKQLPHLKKANLYYKDYAEKSVHDLFQDGQLTNSINHNAFQFATSLIINNGDGTFEVKELPKEVQYSPVYTIEEIGEEKILLAGNFYHVKPEEGRYDANHGVLLDVNENGVTLNKDHDLYLKGEVRDMAIAKSANGGKILIVARNNDEVEFYKF